MKVTIEPVTKFKPIDFTITIESEDELSFLWHLFNMNNSVVKDNSIFNFVGNPPEWGNVDQQSVLLWQKINKLWTNK